MTNLLGRPYKLVIADTGINPTLVPENLRQKLNYIPWHTASAWKNEPINQSHASFVKIICCEYFNTPQLKDQIEVHSYQCLDRNGRGGEESLASAFRYAMDIGADGLNASLGMHLGVDGGKEALDVARSCWRSVDMLGRELYKRGCLIVCAAGNEDTLIDWRADDVDAPAIYPWAVAVTGTGDNGAKIYFAGDGDANEVTFDAQDYYRIRGISGTSFASPGVSGLAAFIETFETGQKWPTDRRMELRLRAVHGGKLPHGAWCRDHGFGSLTPEGKRVLGVVAKLRAEAGYVDNESMF